MLINKKYELINKKMNVNRPLGTITLIFNKKKIIIFTNTKWDSWEFGPTQKLLSELNTLNQKMTIKEIKKKLNSVKIVNSVNDLDKKDLKKLKKYFNCDNTILENKSKKELHLYFSYQSEGSILPLIELGLAFNTTVRKRKFNYIVDFDDDYYYEDNTNSYFQLDDLPQ